MVNWPPLFAFGQLVLKFKNQSHHSGQVITSLTKGTIIISHSKQRHANCQNCRMHVTKSCLFVALHLTGREGGASFLDQSTKPTQS